MTTGALIFMLSAWAFVLGLTLWSFSRLMRSDPSKEPLPPPGTSL
ncbi:MAG TPA: hypothetical protein VF037_00920 [Gemmatimonadales bacterium]